MKSTKTAVLNWILPNAWLSEAVSTRQRSNPTAETETAAFARFERRALGVLTGPG